MKLKHLFVPQYHSDLNDRSQVDFLNRMALTNQAYGQLQSIIQKLFLRALGSHELFAYLEARDDGTALSQLKREPHHA